MSEQTKTQQQGNGKKSYQKVWGYIAAIFILLAIVLFFISPGISIGNAADKVNNLEAVKNAFKEGKDSFKADGYALYKVAFGLPLFKDTKFFKLSSLAHFAINPIFLTVFILLVVSFILSLVPLGKFKSFIVMGMLVAIIVLMFVAPATLSVVIVGKETISGIGYNMGAFLIVSLISTAVAAIISLLSLFFK